MSKPTISLVEGTHITAADKRNIIGTIEYLRQKFAKYVSASPDTIPAYASIKARRPKSPLCYQITPLNHQGRYAVKITARETNDFGRVFERISNVVIQTRNLEPLYMPQSAFANQPEAQPEQPCLALEDDTMTAQNQFDETIAPTSSPWGKVDNAKRIAAGLWEVDTASHGGIYASDQRIAAMNPRFVAASFTGKNWFEEDCDFALVATSFPDCFSAEHVEIALDMLAHHHPELSNLGAAQ